jgi:hypothetical protein
VTGDREGTLRLTRDSTQGTYALVGDDGRIAFEGQPVEVTQISYDGWEFFPEPGECTVSTGNLEGAIGIGFAELSCTDLADIRDNGVISISGTVGLPIDRLVPRELPFTGGTARVGPETWTFEFAYLATWQQPIIAGVTGANMELMDVATQASLRFSYDIATHETSLSAVQRGGEEADVPEGACGLVRTELGKPNPRATTVELTITCPEVEVPGLGSVSIESTVIVDELEWPE